MTVCGKSFQYLVGGLVPDIGPGVLIPVGDPGADRGGEFLDRAVGTAGEPFAGEFAEPALHQIEPGAVGGGEVHHEAGGEKAANA